MPWADCNVVMAGPIEDGRIVIFLRAVDGSFDTYFYAIDAIKRETLATALAAISTGIRVSAGLSAFTEGSIIERLYIYGHNF